MQNPFYEGQKVVCVSDEFPRIEKYSGPGPKYAKKHPVKGQVLIVDEILGEFVRFDIFDTTESCCWWIHKNFAPYDGPVYNAGDILAMESIKDVVM